MSNNNLEQFDDGSLSNYYDQDFSKSSRKISLTLDSLNKKLDKKRFDNNGKIQLPNLKSMYEMKNHYDPLSVRISNSNNYIHQNSSGDETVPINFEYLNKNEKLDSSYLDFTNYGPNELEITSDKEAEKEEFDLETKCRNLQNELIDTRKRLNDLFSENFNLKSTTTNFKLYIEKLTRQNLELKNQINELEEDKKTWLSDKIEIEKKFKTALLIMIVMICLIIMLVIKVGALVI